ncbi:VN1R3 protein, partial [Crocuta crocuta]
DVIFGFLLLCQVGFGFMGNSLLFTLYIYTFLTQSSLKKPIDFIGTHLTLVNVFTIMFRLIPSVMSSFGVAHFLDDVWCKAMIYASRLSWGLSICTTSFMSVFQAVTVSPGNSKWAWLKSKLSTCIFSSFLSCWVMNLLIYIQIFTGLQGNTNFTAVGFGYSQVYCQTKQNEVHYPGALISIMLIQDLLFVILMVLSSIYVVNLLYRHHRRTQHVHSPRLSSQPSPEIQATHSVLLLVSCFVFFYCLSNCLTIYLSSGPWKNARLERIAGSISACYPTICPFVLMKNNKIISKL